MKAIKKSIMLCLLMFVGIGIKAEVYSGKCGNNAKWELNTETGVLQIKGSGSIQDYMGSYVQSSIEGDLINSETTWKSIPTSYIAAVATPWYQYRDYINKIIIDDNITRIGKNTFSGLKSLQSVSLSNTITEIGEGAFAYCYNLQQINFPSSLLKIEIEAFMYSGLTNISMPSSINTIGDYAFCGCQNLLNVDLSACTSLDNIGSSIFSACYCLVSPIYTPTVLVYMPEGYAGSYSIPNGIVSIANGAFKNCKDLLSISMPNTITNIGESAFSGCDGLRSIGLPNSIEYIGGYAFYGCDGLKSIGLPNSIEYIGGYAFYGCDGLSSLKLPEGLVTIEEHLCYMCRNLTSVEMPESVTEIQNGAFGYCSSLVNVNLPNSIIKIESGSFYGCTSIGQPLYNKNFFVFMPPTFEGAFSVPNEITTICDNAFGGCNKLTSIEIPNSVTTIGSFTFEDCNKLTSIEIPNSVTSIGSGAFSGCSGLTSIEIPNSVTSIGDGAFEDCNSLYSITINSNVSVKAQNAIFNNCSKLGILNLNTDEVSQWLYFNNLYELNYGDNVSAISKCFDNDINKVSIGKSVNTIKTNVFANCERLRAIISYAEKPPFCYPYVFKNVPKDQCIVYVPKGCLESYKEADQWKDFERIEEMNIFEDDEMISGTEMGHDYIDLGLPSGALWATDNVGQYISMNYGYSSDWGKPWVCPSYDELKELRDMCSWTWGIKNGDLGYRVTGKNGNSIFLPANGSKAGGTDDVSYRGTNVWYWSSDQVDKSLYYTLEAYRDGVAIMNLSKSAYIALRLVTHKEVTGIHNLQIDRNNKNDAAFDLRGRKVINPTNGIYILNGKKVLIK